ncbi:MAG: hydroxyacid dehydrogenase [Dongiaceae bacterium]
MGRVLVLGHINEAGMALLRARPDVTLDLLPGASDAELIARLGEVDGILVRTNRLSAAVLDAAPRLRVVSRHGVGYDNVDLAALDRRRIPLTVVGDVNAVPVAELAFFLMLAVAKQGLAHDRATRSGNWGLRERFSSVELAGKRLLVVGFGRIGRQVAARAAAFGMQVEACDPYVAAATMAAAGVRKAASLRAGLTEADFVTLHTPLTDETRNILDAAALAAMKPGARLICTARGGLIDEAALVDALRSGRLAGAGLDVFAAEPPAADDPLLALDSVVLSPHIGALTQECGVRMAEVSARNVLAGLDGTLDPALVVNPHVLGR